MRTFLPFTTVDGAVNDDNIWAFLPAIKHGLVTLEHPDYPRPMRVTVIQDSQEKLLTYFITGGQMDQLTREQCEAITSDDYVVVLVTDTSSNPMAAFLYERYERDTIHFAHLQRPFSYDHFINMMIDQGYSFLEKEVNLKGV
jgi:hypothetical protein